jgi:hypothetical protein
MKRRLFVTGSIGTMALLGIGCGSGDPSCEAPPGLTADQRAQRGTLHYFDRATNPTRTCASCSFFTAGAAGACGSCTLGLGAVSPLGGCDGFAQRS